MTDTYIPQEIEPQWRQRWEETGLYATREDPERPKYYFLTMLPYPSADFLHVGHWYVMAPSDVRARFMRMRGYNVFYPIGFDAFGLPAENAAIQRGIHPAKWAWDSIHVMRQQLRMMGAMWAWDREAVTCLPEYYKWTQWFFLRFYEAGLAYKKLAPVDFCPKCNTTLAREQVWGEDRHCERCHTPVIKKELEQWFFRITDYAEELLDHSQLDWPENICTMQKNWIGRSEGANVTFLSEQGDPIVVFTTRPDTLWGATFMVLAPEHPLVDKLTAAEFRQAVAAYQYQASRQSEIERLSTEKEKTGVFIGAFAINPVNNERIPIWIADYVMMTYGTGAIMAVPAHDERDFAFAQKYGLPIRVVIRPPDWDGEPLRQAFVDVETGVMINSGPFDGTPAQEGKQQVTDWLAAQGKGEFAINYRLRDWLISRQRYWGAPIPIIYCDRCGIVPVPYEDLPVILPTDAVVPPTGENALKFHEGFLHTTCPRCGGLATRETDTMDTFMCSSWYQYAYVTPYHRQGQPLHRDDCPWDPQAGRYWLPVDMYTGGPEHAHMHLLYTRFFTKVLRDLGLVDFDEPMLALRNQGIILGPDGSRMSKSAGNVVLPDELVKQYGTDAVRAYLMFGWRWDQGGPWDPQGIEGVYRWLNRVWNLVLEPGETSAAAGEKEVADLRRWTHRTIRRVSEDVENFAFNTVIAALMELTNALTRARPTLWGTAAWTEGIETLLLLLAPCCPHLAEELWARSGHAYSIHQQSWPTYDPALIVEETITLVVQIGGKVRARLEVPADIGEEAARQAALADPNVQRYLEGKEPRKVIVVPGRLVNIVV